MVRHRLMSSPLLSSGSTQETSRHVFSTWCIASFFTGITLHAFFVFRKLFFKVNFSEWQTVWIETRPDKTSDLGPNYLQRLSAENTSRQRMGDENRKHDEDMPKSCIFPQCIDYAQNTPCQKSCNFVILFVAFGHLSHKSFV